MNDISQWMKRRSRDSRRGAIPWWAWAIAAAGGLSVLVSWILRRRSVLTLPEPAEEDIPYPKIKVADNTPVSSIPPVVQDIPLPPRNPEEREPAGHGSSPLPSAQAVLTAEQAKPQDDLTVIEGIGPVISGILQRSGITSYTQLAETDTSRLEQLLHDANLRVSDPSSWAEQARLAAAGDWDGLRELQDQLKGGRRA